MLNHDHIQSDVWNSQLKFYLEQGNTESVWLEHSFYLIGKIPAYIFCKTGGRQNKVYTTYIQNTLIIILNFFNCGKMLSN